jgi:hypothetical protein
MDKRKEAGVIKIFTHVNVDLDAVASVWFAKRFIYQNFKTKVFFVPAGWGGEELGENDLALDIWAGGKGIKGEEDKDGRVHSCFKSLVKNYGDQKISKSLKGLIKYIDQKDFSGTIKALNRFGNDRDNFIVLYNSLKLFRVVHGDDGIVCSRMLELFDGIFKINQSKKSFLKNIKQSVIPVGKTAIVTTRDSTISARGYLFNNGYEAVIYTDQNGIGLLVKSGHRADCKEVLEVVERAGESNEWFAHPAGYLFCRGSRKSPAKNPSKVDPYDIAIAFEKYRKNKK